jgi:predicted SprT family Zn-dependent metalloprotease
LAYNYFNKTLFNGELADCLLVFGRDQKSCYGYFHAEQWASREDAKRTTHMISLTPRHLSRPLEAVFGTLVHEMCHLWQQDHGEPSKNGYHNAEWADTMEQVGLNPNTTPGQEGGKRTGPKVSHDIAIGGPFAVAFSNIPSEFCLPWIGRTTDAKKKSAKNKIKYACKVCEANAWGKPELNILCGDCDQVMEPV